ncbi:hypothetical protein [Natronoglycomyces albus]|uniref:Uncharacterized protein n=1 Tax=Natronoglycomyces albus TaxID=2811108 RepID=A0A895XGF0_9ACTN|nr:hypothetical protein [Natronoglycomyces albus]QSB03947.1 hypothetical protein JQS30_08925 [Natronoglycomyces albus]
MTTTRETAQVMAHKLNPTPMVFGAVPRAIKSATTAPATPSAAIHGPMLPAVSAPNNVWLRTSSGSASPNGNPGIPIVHSPPSRP